jgi:hexosaminidase
MLVWVLGCQPAVTADPPQVIPAPVSMTVGEGAFILDDRVTVSGPMAATLAGWLRPPTGAPLTVVDDGGTIAFVADPSLDEAAYHLEVTPKGITVSAGSDAGWFYGAQTVRQLFPAEIYGSARVDRDWAAPVVVIDDAPRFEWRGLMIDVARHFFTVAEIERQIDLMAMHKLNRLHLHLTDDQGWRLEIPSRPLLTEIGGVSEVGGGPGGFYSREDWDALIAYAQARQIVLVPEIDFPGHSNAALSAYPELNASGVAAEPYTDPMVLSAPLCLDCEATMPFVEAVWRDVCRMTPGPWVHLGADEVDGLDPAAYAAFVKQVVEVVADEGKLPIGWDEIGDARLEPPFIAQHWVDDARARAAVEDGGTLISSPAYAAYFDMIYDGDAEFGQFWAGPVDVQRAYDWYPAPPLVPIEAVEGVEAALWTELIADEAQMDFMLWPRLAAQAELDWSPSTDWEGLRPRLAAHGRRLDALGVGYYRSPEVDW